MIVHLRTRFARTARNPSRRWRRAASLGEARASPACSKRMPAAITDVDANRTAAIAATRAWKWALIRSPATNGPKNAPTPSPVLQTVFAATSSSGLRAIAGISVAWVGRTGAAAVAASVEKKNSWIIVIVLSSIEDPAVAIDQAIPAA